MHVVINALSSTTCPSGICRHAANLCRCLTARNEVSKISLLIGAWQAGYFGAAFEIIDPKLAIVPIEITNLSSARNFWYLFGLPRIVSSLAGDLVHLSFPVPILHNRIAVPVVTTLHDLYPYDVPENFGFPNVLGNRICLRRCLSGSDLVTCVSDCTLGRLIALFGDDVRKKAVRIYNCVEFASICSVRRPQLPGLDRRSFLLCVAQHRRNKNLELLLKAFAQLTASGVLARDTALLVVGRPGPETASMKKTINQLSLEGSVLLVHGVSDSELAWLYANCDLLLAPSAVEGFGLPVVEALQCGARIVCSDLPVFHEMGGPDCSYFDLNAASPVDALAMACEVALRKPRSIKVPDPRFSVEAIGSQYIAAYSQLLMNPMSRVEAGVGMGLTRQPAQFL